MAVKVAKKPKAKAKVTKEFKKELATHNESEVEINTRVTKKSSGVETTLVDEGKHLNSSTKRDILNPNKFVGINIGITKNLDNYESLRVDVWIADNVQEDETHADTLQRLTDIAVNHAEATIIDIVEE